MTPIHFPRNEAFRTLLALLLGLIIVSFVRSVRSSSSAHATSAHYSRLSVRANPGDDGSPMDISSQGGVESTASVTPDEKLPWFETDSGKGCVLQTLMKQARLRTPLKLMLKPSRSVLISRIYHRHPGSHSLRHRLTRGHYRPHSECLLACSHS